MVETREHNNNLDVDVDGDWKLKWMRLVHFKCHRSLPLRSDACLHRPAFIDYYYHRFPSTNCTIFQRLASSYSLARASSVHDSEEMKPRKARKLGSALSECIRKEWNRDSPDIERRPLFGCRVQRAGQSGPPSCIISHVIEMQLPRFASTPGITKSSLEDCSVNRMDSQILDDMGKCR